MLLDVSLNVFVPTVNLNGGNGVVNGSLKNNAPLRSPKVSGINLTLATVACDHLFHQVKSYLLLQIQNIYLYFIN